MEAIDQWFGKLRVDYLQKNYFKLVQEVGYKQNSTAIITIAMYELAFPARVQYTKIRFGQSKTMKSKKWT